MTIKNYKNKEFQDGSFCKGFTTTYCDFHQEDSKIGLFKKGDQKLRKLIIIKNFKNKFYLVQFIGNNNSKPHLKRSFTYKECKYSFNLQNCYIIPKSCIDHSISFIPNRDFKWIKKDCLDFIESRSKRKVTYDRVTKGEFDNLSDAQALAILNEEQFNSREKWNRNTKEELEKRIKLYKQQMQKSQETIDQLKSNISNEKINLEEELEL